VPALPEGTEEQAHLPRIIRALVQRRRTVKDLIKSERDPVGGCADGWLRRMCGLLRSKCACATGVLVPDVLWHVCSWGCFDCKVNVFTEVKSQRSASRHLPVPPAGAPPAAGDPTAGVEADRQLHVWVPGLCQLPLLRPAPGGACHLPGTGDPAVHSGPCAGHCGQRGAWVGGWHATNPQLAGRQMCPRAGSCDAHAGVVPLCCPAEQTLRLQMLRLHISSAKLTAALHAHAGRQACN
jgi:hypothetical protein